VLACQPQVYNQQTQLLSKCLHSSAACCLHSKLQLQGWGPVCRPHTSRMVRARGAPTGGGRVPGRRRLPTRWPCCTWAAVGTCPAAPHHVHCHEVWWQRQQPALGVFRVLCMLRRSAGALGGVRRITCACAVMHSCRTAVRC
jgi:hypothetical protein